MWKLHEMTSQSKLGEKQSKLLKLQATLTDGYAAHLMRHPRLEGGA